MSSAVSDQMIPWTVACQAPLVLDSPWDYPGKNTEAGAGCHILLPKRSSPHRDGTCGSSISCLGRWILYHWATWEAQ